MKISDETFDNIVAEIFQLRRLVEKLTEQVNNLEEHCESGAYHDHELCSRALERAEQAERRAAEAERRAAEAERRADEALSRVAEVERLARQ